VKFRFTFYNFILRPYCVAQVLSYVVCTQLRRHVHKQITKRIYREEKPRRFVFKKPVFCTLGLGLTTPYCLGLLVWNFYQTFFFVCVEFRLRFEPQIRSTRFAIIFFIDHYQGWKEGLSVCESIWLFFLGEYSSAWLEFSRVLSQI